VSIPTGVVVADDEKSGSTRRQPKRRPRGARAESILDVALELFAERGYYNTSIREIADTLDMTGAALYYHFNGKEDILLALHLRLDAIARDTLERLAQLDVGEASSEALLTVFHGYIDDLLANPQLVRFQARNQQALEQVLNEANASDQAHLDEQLRRITPLALRVRLLSALAAVRFVLTGSDIAFSDTAAPRLVATLRETIHHLITADQTPTERVANRRSDRQAEPKGSPEDPPRPGGIGHGTGGGLGTSRAKPP
jgi:AcrR family transcriptional regulator